MALGKQAKVLTKQQVDALYLSLALTREPERNRLIFLLSVKAGLRAKEIAGLTWSMVVDASGLISEQICLENIASKGKSGRTIPINKHLKGDLEEHLCRALRRFPLTDLLQHRVVETQRGSATSAQVIVNMFKGWYAKAGLVGCSSHSGRRTFITNAANEYSGPT